MSISYTPTTWADGADGGTPITAARLNNIEQGVNAATTQVNANTKEIKTLGDSVSQRAVRSYVGWGTSVRVKSPSALLVFYGGGSVYGFWTPESTPKLVKVAGSDMSGIAVTNDGDAYVVSWTKLATCLAIS